MTIRIYFDSLPFFECFLIFGHEKMFQAHLRFPDPPLDLMEVSWSLSWRMVFRNQDLSLVMLLAAWVLPPPGPLQRQS